MIYLGGHRFGERPYVAIRNKTLELISTFSRNVLLDSSQPLYQCTDIVISILIIIDRIDNFLHTPRGLDRRLLSEVSRLFEVLKQCAIETIVNRKMGLVDFLALSRSASEHLSE